MRLIGMMACRQEEWVVGFSLRAALLWCEEMVVLVHASTDNTREIVTEIAKETNRVTVVVDDNQEWDEMRHRQAMLEIARTSGATHLAICDSDEVLTGNLLQSKSMPASSPSAIAASLQTMGANEILQLPGYNLRNSISQYHSNGIWGNRWFSTAFADNPKLGWSGDRFHAREPQGLQLKPYRPIPQGQGGVMHLWAVSDRRLRAKHRLYRLTERLRWPDKDVRVIEEMYSWATKGRPRFRDTPETWTFETVPDNWWAPYQHLMKYYHPEIVPWQEAECERIIAEHGIGKFQGLDLS